MASIKNKSKLAVTQSKQAKNNASLKATLQPFMQENIDRMHKLGKVRTGETYTCTLNSFMRFRQGKDVFWKDFDADLMASYEAYLKSTGVSMNTISFYNRILRAVYNRAVEKGFTKQTFPFRNVYTGVEKTIRRGLPVKTIRHIRNMDLSHCPTLDYARDMFLFSFYTRGMSFIDMAYLKKNDLKNGVLTYRRKKTGQRLCVRWERHMQDILEKYHISQESPYLLPIIHKAGKEERKQYSNALHLVNKKLKIISKALQLSVPLTMYVARHSWATVAKSKNIPLSVISEGMGHDSENTTLIYLASLDTAIIDKANKLILNLL
ncbi:site-specific integrase [uncultured Bacteroides sp.]|uniref:tyrosine-type recombinase/integrase n=1 Tax=uncultured Bacteroides sp. TaxID=162156 RepID=UPI00258716E3|nr:site-specific integrase [uncultured Bacteroides sp.]